jgi:hypothetical protein
MGHVSVDAAMVHQHRTGIRDRAIADSMDAMIGTLNQVIGERSGTLRARRLASRDLRFPPSRRIFLRLGLSRLERTTGIEPAFSAWEDIRRPAHDGS